MVVPIGVGLLCSCVVVRLLCASVWLLFLLLLLLLCLCDFWVF